MMGRLRVWEVGVQGPGMGMASLFPGQGGMVAMRTERGSGPGVAELESGAGGDIEADAWTQVQDLFPTAILTPDLSFAFKNVPDFLNGAVDDRG